MNQDSWNWMLLLFLKKNPMRRENDMLAEIRDNYILLFGRMDAAILVSIYADQVLSNWGP